ncbi:regulator of G-protein signaling 18 [Electrophorus electricus]|uniref:RGS domain-containing protein n=1 Tax=Electrophorus electricus TaxID=8005 RepID=A0A4W4GSA7_ELEEL|nr:regulator of G-protein signaling 18 [Electrophorus electricus]
MRRFSSEGSLQDLEFLSWKRAALKDDIHDEEVQEDTYKHLSHLGNETARETVTFPCTPAVLESAGGRSVLTKEHSVSVETLTNLDNMSSGFLRVTALNESFKAYSDSQLTGRATDSTDSMGKEEDTVPSPSSMASHCCFQTPESQTHRYHVMSKLSAAKLHLKSLFGQSPQSSHSNLAAAEQRDQENSVKEKRSRFRKQWSQVGHGKTRLSRQEVEKWAESLHALLDSRVGVSVFEAFLRSEFSEENLQFYLACEQYRRSSNTFSLQRRAKEIIATYIQPGAPREINLDFKTRELTLQLLKAPSHNSLCHAQQRIRSLLDTDCYPRFLQSNIYLTLLSDGY